MRTTWIVRIVEEIGRLLGGWIKQSSGKNPQEALQS